jgi:hypothetical protein
MTGASSQINKCAVDWRLARGWLRQAAHRPRVIQVLLASEGQVSDLHLELLMLILFIYSSVAQWQSIRLLTGGL